MVTKQSVSRRERNKALRRRILDAALGLFDQHQPQPLRSSPADPFLRVVARGLIALALLAATLLLVRVLGWV
jgi:hypothetical protein